MNVRKYRAVLAGIIVVALAAGFCLYTKNKREQEIPTDGILVYEMYQDEDVNIA